MKIGHFSEMKSLLKTQLSKVFENITEYEVIDLSSRNPTSMSNNKPTHFGVEFKMK